MFCALSGGANPVDNWVNWSLIGLGIVLVIFEVLLGAATGFDLALIGVSLATGGGIGLAFASTKVGLFSGGALALLYLAFFRRMIRARLASGGKPSNVDAIMGRSGVVLERIAPNAAGQVKVGDEIWRARLESESGAALEPGQTVTVASVDGVTLKVR
jgi:membrane protein implicated in regulation of membrane protease activity